MSFVDVLQESAKKPLRNPTYVPSGAYLCEISSGGRIVERNVGDDIQASVNFGVKILKPIDVDKEDLADVCGAQGLTEDEVLERFHGQISFRVWGKDPVEMAETGINDTARKIKRTLATEGDTPAEVFDNAVGSRCVAEFDLSEGRDGPTNWPAWRVSRPD